MLFHRRSLRLALLLPALALAACDADPAGAAPAADRAPRAASTAASDDPAGVRRAIEANNARLIRTFLDGDAAAAASLFADDAVLLLPGMPMLAGRAAIQQGLAGIFGADRYTEVVAQVHEVQVFGDYALEMGTSRFTYQAGGQTFSEPGKYIVAWKRQPGGTWLIHRDISNGSGPAR